MNNKPIGIFDSGSGGLTVLAEIKKQLPQESVLYYGDLARMPYGSKSREEIIQYNEEIIGYLVERGVKMIIVACNTSSAVALQDNKSKFDVPIVGLIGPGSQAAWVISRNNKIGVIATEATVRSQAYKKVLSSLNSDVEVYEQACPKFVPLIESGKADSTEMDKAVEEYLVPLLARGVDTIIHGCTHYPLIEKKLKAKAGDAVQFVNPAVGTVALAKQILEKSAVLSDGPAHYEFVASKIDGGNYVRVDGRGLFFGGASAI
jgi:glutamate racemase